MDKTVPKWLFASILLTAILSLTSLIFRFKVERNNRAVGVMIEGQAVHDIAAVSGQPLSYVLFYLKESGLSGVALTEQTVGDLIDTGQVAVTPGTNNSIELSGSPSTLSRIALAIGRRGGLGTNPSLSNKTKIVFTGDSRVLRQSSIGIDPDDANTIRQVGLDIVCRHFNTVGAGPAYLRDLLESSRSLGAVGFLPAGDQVLGQRDSIDDLAVTLKDIGMSYLTPEFAKLGGDSKLTAQIPELTIRTHSMQAAEMDKATTGAIIERYTKAFRERNIRWLLIRPLSNGGSNVLQSTGQFLNALRTGLIKEGGGVKTPRPFTDPQVPKFLIVLIAMSCIPWLIWSFRQMGNSRLILVACAISALLMFASWLDGARPLAGLLIGIMSPVISYQIWIRIQPKNIVLSYVLVSAISIIGGLAIAGMLISLPYLIQVKQALGIKAILLAPILIIAWILIHESSNFSKISRQTIEWGPLLLGLVVLGAVAVLAIRSGNDAAGAVSETELKFRGVLDRILYTRPRTKEILIGHPALIMGLGLWNEAKSRPEIKSWGTLALIIGSIGQSDLVDTLCHTHTPLDIGIARIVIGLIIGGMMGCALWAISKKTFLNRGGQN